MPSPYQYGNRLSNVFGEGGADRLSGILGGVDQDALNAFNRGSSAWGMSDLAGLTRSGLFQGGDLDFLRGLRGADRDAGQKPWQVWGQADPRSVAPGGGARRDIRKGNRQYRRENRGGVNDPNYVDPNGVVPPNFDQFGGKNRMGSK